MKITVDLAANTGRFESEFKRAEQTVKSRMASIEDAAKKAGVAIGAALAAGATAATAALKNAVDRMDNISKSASRIGIATEALSGLEFAARLSDVSLEQLSGRVLRLTKNIGEAAAGNKLYADTFRAVGIATTNADGSLRKTEEVLGDVAAVFKALPDGAEKSKLAIDLFGRSGAQLIPLLNNGREGLAAMTEEARALGLVFDAEAGKQAEEFNDALTRVQAGLQGAATQVGVGLLPKLTEMAAALQSEGFRNGFGTIIEGAVTAAIKVAELVAGIGNLTKFVGEEIAARVGGPAIGDIARIEEAIERQRNISENMNLFGWEYDKQAVADARAELVRLEELLRMSQQAAEEQAAAELQRAAAQRESTAATADTSASTDALLEGLRRMREEQATAAEVAKRAADARRAQAQAEREAARVMQQAAKQRSQRAADGAAFLASTRQLAAALQGPMAVALAKYNDQMDEATRLQFEGSITTEQAREAMALFAAELQKAEEEFEASGEKAQWMRSILDQFGETRFEGLVNEIERVGEALKTALTPDQRKAMLNYMQELQTAAGEYRQQGLETMVGATQQVLGSIQQLSEKGSKEYKAMEVASQALNVVLAIGAVLNQGKGDPYTAFARMAAMAVAVAGLVGSIGANFGGSNGFTDTAAERQETQGTGTVLGDAEAKSESIANATEITADATSALVGINRGMLRALQALQDGIAGAGGMLARGAGRADFAGVGGNFDFGSAFMGGFLSSVTNRVLDPLGILGGSSRITDQGIAIGGGGLADVSVNAYQEQQYRRWRFGSRRTAEEMSPVSDDFQAQFQLIVDSLVDTVREGAIALGLLPADIEAALEAFRLEEIRISLKDLSAEEQQAELAAVFSSIFDNLAGDVVPFIEQFQRVGEGLGETLVRVATGVQVTREALARLGFSLEAAGPEQFAQISEGLIDLVGGIEQFINGMQSFMDSFAPEAHKFAVLQNDIARAFAEVGLTVPETREGMWELMQSLDASTEAGREQIATLLRLSSTADSYYRMLEDGFESEYQDRIDHLDRLIEANRAYYDFAEDIARQYLQEFGSTLTVSLVDVERTYRQNIATANELARAAGMAGASERELARIELIAARQRAEAIRLTMESARDIAGDLGLTELAQIEQQIAALESSTAGIQSAIGGVSDAFDDAADRARRTMDLLIGDLSPLRDAEKLQIALQGLRAGTVSADQVLQIGQRLYASGADYRSLFAQVMEIEQNRPITGGPVNVGGGGGPAPIDPALQDLLTRRDEILAAQAAEEARANAMRLIEQIAELSDAQSISFEAVAAQLGISLTDLAERAGVDQDTLTQLLEAQQQEAIEQREAALEIPDRLADAINPLLEEQKELRALSEQQLAELRQITINTNRTADASESAADTASNRDLVETSAAPRSNRIGLAGGGRGGLRIDQGPVLVP